MSSIAFPAGNVIALANKILQLAADPVELNRYRASQETLVRRRAWPAIARDFAALVGERIDSYSRRPRGIRHRGTVSRPPFNSPSEPAPVMCLSGNWNCLRTLR